MIRLRSIRSPRFQVPGFNLILIGLSCVFLFLIVTSMVPAQTASTRLYNMANSLYEEGKYQEAISKYKQVVATGLENGFVYYNLGNAYFKDQQLGQAILAYEKARRLLPRDEDIRANLDYANQFTVDKIEIQQPGWIAQMIRGLYNLFSLQEVTILVWILYIVLCVCVVLFVFSRDTRIRSILLQGGSIALVVLIVAGISLALKIRTAESTRLAIVMVPKVDARSGPGDEYTQMFVIHEGTKVRIRQSREGWHLISLPGGTGGWVEGKAVERI